MAGEKGEVIVAEGEEGEEESIFSIFFRGDALLPLLFFFFFLLPYRPPPPVLTGLPVDEQLS